jgi:hypothetical protein
MQSPKLHETRHVDVRDYMREQELEAWLLDLKRMDHADPEPRLHDL